MLALIAVHARANAPWALSVKRMERALSMLMLVSAAVHAQAFVLRKQFPKNNASSLRQFWNRYMQDGSVCTGCRLLFYLNGEVTPAVPLLRSAPGYVHYKRF